MRRRVKAGIFALDRRAMARGEADAVDAPGREPAQLLERGRASKHVVGDAVCYFFLHRVSPLSGLDYDASE
jgi:hypothetical protein